MCNVMETKLVRIQNIQKMKPRLLKRSLHCWRAPTCRQSEDENTGPAGILAPDSWPKSLPARLRASTPLQKLGNLGFKAGAKTEDMYFKTIF